MIEWAFRFMMKILAVIIISGIIALVAWKIAFLVAILAILSPFAFAIYLKTVRKIKSVEGVKNG